MTSTTGYVVFLQDIKKIQTLKQTVGPNEVHAVSISLIDENGAAYGVKHVGNKPRVSSMPYLYDIAEGNIDDHYILNKFGHNSTVGTAYEEIWSGSTVYPFMTTADNVEILSDSVEDDTDKGGAVAGTGAWTVEITGLNALWDEYSETVTLNGAGVVTTSGRYIRVHRAKVVTAGSGLINAGTLTMRDATADTTRAIIEPAVGQTLMAVWTVPRNYTYYMTAWYAGSSVSKAIDIGVWARDNTVTNAAFQNKRFLNFTDQVFREELTSPNVFTEKTDIVVRAKVGVAGGGISAGFSGWYEL